MYHSFVFNSINNCVDVHGTPTVQNGLSHSRNVQKQNCDGNIKLASQRVICKIGSHTCVCGMLYAAMSTGLSIKC